MMNHMNDARGYDRDHSSSSWGMWQLYAEATVNPNGPDDGASTPSESTTCTGSSNSGGLYSPTFSPQKWHKGAWKAGRSPEVLCASRGNMFVDDKVGGPYFTRRSESGLDSNDFLTDDEVNQPFDRTGQGVDELEAYLSKQRQQLSAAISAEWVTSSTPLERKLKMELACHELVRRSFAEVRAAAQAKTPRN